MFKSLPDINAEINGHRNRQQAQIDSQMIPLLFKLLERQDAEKARARRIPDALAYNEAMHKQGLRHSDETAQNTLDRNMRMLGPNADYEIAKAEQDLRVKESSWDMMKEFLGRQKFEEGKINFAVERDLWDRNKSEMQRMNLEQARLNAENEQKLEDEFWEYRQTVAKNMGTLDAIREFEKEKHLGKLNPAPSGNKPYVYSLNDLDNKYVKIQNEKLTVHLLEDGKTITSEVHHDIKTGHLHRVSYHNNERYVAERPLTHLDLQEYRSIPANQDYGSPSRGTYSESLAKKTSPDYKRGGFLWTNKYKLKGDGEEQILGELLEGNMNYDHLDRNVELTMHFDKNNEKMVVFPKYNETHQQGHLEAARNNDVTAVFNAANKRMAEKILKEVEKERKNTLAMKQPPQMDVGGLNAMEAEVPADNNDLIRYSHAEMRRIVNKAKGEAAREWDSFAYYLKSYGNGVSSPLDPPSNMRMPFNKLRIRYPEMTDKEIIKTALMKVGETKRNIGVGNVIDRLNHPAHPLTRDQVKDENWKPVNK